MTRLFTLLLLSVAVLTASCSKHSAGFQMPPRPVTAATVTERDVPVYLDEIGACVAPEIVSIVPQVTGKIVAVHFTEGTDVKKGDSLFTIDERPYQADLDKAQAQLEQDQSKLVLSQDQLKRSEALVSGNFISKQDLQNLQVTVATNDAQVKADEAAIATAKLNLEYCEIVSPIDGRLGKRLVDEGNVVSANQAAALVVVQRMDPLYVDFTVAETDLPSVREYFDRHPLKVEVRQPEKRDAVREGDLHFLDSSVQVSAGTVQLRATMENQDRAFWPGQFVEVRLVLDTIPHALLVPATALQISQQGPFVFVVKDDSTVELRPVKPGQRQGDMMVISEGLHPGEKVVVTGQLALAPGGKVAVIDPAAAQKAAAAAPQKAQK